MKPITLVSAALGVVAVPVLAQAVGLPQLRAGYWEQTQTLADLPADAPQEARAPRPSRFCIDDSVQARINAMMSQQSRAGCGQPRVSRAGNATVLEVTCQLPNNNGTVTNRTTYSGDYRSSFSTETTTTLTGRAAAGGQRPPRLLVSGHYLGACPADLRPGDITSPDLPKANMLDANPQR